MTHFERSLLKVFMITVVCISIIGTTPNLGNYDTTNCD